MEDELLNGLTEAQRDAVTHNTGPCLVVAGPGTGKTKVITSRIAHLILVRKIAPESIVALTFTDKAAREMEERLDQLLPYGITGTTLSTFHSYCNELLKRHTLLLGLSPSATLLSNADEISFLRQHSAELPARRYRPNRNPTDFLKMLISFISKARDEYLAPAQIIEYATQRRAAATDEGDQEQAELIQELGEMYAVVENLYQEHGFLSYGDLVYYAVKLLKEFPSVRKQEGERINYLLVDEFQDTNLVQSEFARLLSDYQKNIMVVGDDDQAIYQFRGANLQNILTFTKTFPDARVITLKDNFRSTQPILDAAYRLIQHNNPARLEIQENVSKKLTSHANKQLPVEHHHFQQSVFEYQFIATTIKDLVEAGTYKPEEIAILIRSKSQAANIELALDGVGIDHQFSGDSKFFTQPIIRIVTAYLRFLANPHHDLNLFFLLSQTPFSVDERVLHRHTHDARYQTISLYDNLLETPEKEMEPQLLEALQYLKKSLSTGNQAKPSQALALFLNDKWKDTLRQQSDSNDLLGMFYNELTTAEQGNRLITVQEYIYHLDYLLSTDEEVALQQSQEGVGTGVQILTAHKSKGLEFPVVFVSNLAQGRFPSRNYSDRFPFPYQLTNTPTPGSQSNLPEERRLAYVAMTRAKEQLILTSSEQYGDNRTKSKLSPFVVEALGLVDPPHPKQQDIETVITQASKEEAERKPLHYAPGTKFAVSALEAYQQCPQRYKYQYVLKIKTPASAAANFGTSIHRTLQLWFEAKNRGESADLDDLYEASWLPGGYFSKEQEQQRYHEGLEKLRTYLASQADLPSPLYLEHTFQTKRQDGTCISGKVDRVDLLPNGSVRVVDYKTSERAPQAKELLDHLPLYAYTEALTAQGQTVEEVELQYVMAGETLRTNVANLHKEAIYEGIERTIQAIQESALYNDYPAKPDRILCGYCDYREVCPFRHGY